MNAPGDVLPATLGRYEIVRLIAGGGEAQVYEARDPLLERRVALKVLKCPAPSSDDAHETDYATRFLDEARSCSALSHPNVVVVYDAGNSDGTAFMAMELLEGQSLASLLQSHGRLDLDRALDVAEQAAEALACAHDHGIVHRDIKPGNLVMLPDGMVKVTDFGIARRRSDECGAGEGSPRYMSPEQVLRKRAQPESDLFSLGVVFYQMLTGQVPFSGADLNAILFQIVHVAPPPPSTLDQTLPEMIDFIVAKLLAKSPDERYSSARELADDLRQCRASLDAPTPLSTLDIFKPSTARLDAIGAAPLLARDAPATRSGDPPPHVASPALDPHSSTVRFEEHKALSGRVTQGAAEQIEAPAPHVDFTRAGWSQRDWLIFAAGVTAASLLGGLILVV